jgi:hypothetical protein
MTKGERRLTHKAVQNETKVARNNMITNVSTTRQYLFQTTCQSNNSDKKGNQPQESVPFESQHKLYHDIHTWAHSPTVLATLTGNTMQTCSQVDQIIKVCRAAASDEWICEVASKYYELCH